MAPVALDPATLVLVAHPEVEAGKAVADAITRWGLSALLVHDGVEAILQIQRTLPRVVVLDAALPKMFGFQVCELMKRNEQLRSIPVVLVGAIYDQDRYRRAPGELYGADAYVERHQLPDALMDPLMRFGLRPAPAVLRAQRAQVREAGSAGLRSRPATSSPDEHARSPQGREAAAQRGEAERSGGPREAGPASEDPQGGREAAAQRGEAGPASEDPRAAERRSGGPTAGARNVVEEGQRLARIIVSDVVLYNAEKFAAAVRAGNVLEALSAELEEGYSLFAQRVDPRVCDPREFLQHELLRVARARGMK